MTQRRTYTRSSSNNRNRGSSYSSYKKSTPSRYQPTGKRNSKRPHSSGALKIVLAILLVAVLASGAFLIIKNIPTVSANGNAIAEGITVDNISVSGMTKDEAYSAVQAAGQAKIDNISITFKYNDKVWTFTAHELQAALNVQSVIDQAYEVGKTGTSKENRQVLNETRTYGLTLHTDVTVDRDVLVEALKDVKNEIDQPMVEASIEFDPSNYDYFEDTANPDVDMSRDMFTITPGTVGYVMDYDKALQDLNDALTNGWTAEIQLSVIEEHPKYTVEELEECTTLVFHSSSKISTQNKKDSNRNHNISKAIGFYKGMVVMPGDIVDYNSILGERTLSSGWLEANTITQEKVLEPALGGGICQASTTIFNAAFVAGAKIIDRGPHSWPAYYQDYGYGMDAMVNWGTDEFIFQNDSDYPMFINTYFWYDAYGTPGYIDVDIYTMPQKDENGNILHIRSESTILRREAPPAPIYREAEEGQFPEANWTVDEALGKMVYTYRAPKDLVEVSVDRVWYKDCVMTSPGVWEGGAEVKREHSHIDLYNYVQSIIYTKPIPEPTATPTPTPTPAP